MNYRKATLGLSIALGVIVEGYIGAVDDELLLAGIMQSWPEESRHILAVTTGGPLCLS